MRSNGFHDLPRVALWATLAMLVAGCGQGSISSTPSTLPLATLTPIAECVVNSENDVIIGGPDALPGCDNVEMEPSAGNPASFDEIMVADGGTLTITGGDEDEEESSTAAATPRASIPIAPLETPIREICIESGGTVEYGTKAKPITSRNKVVLEFIGARNSISPNLCKNFRKGIEVMAGGTLRMYGAKGVPARGGVSWTTLAAPAGSQVAGAKVKSMGLKTLKLSADVTKGAEGWQPGDWIVVATTSYSPFETEFVQIDTVTSDPKGGSTVTLLQPLKYYHFGSLPPSPASETCTDPLDSSKTQPAFLCDGADRNWGVDERAEVGLVSRDIELVAGIPDDADNLHWGGEIMIHPGFKEVSIQGVRLSKFGKDQLGSYPIHFHMLGDAQNKPLIDANSIDHSYNHCITIHSTSNLTISNLVCARIVGHIFYQELMGANEDNPADDSGIVFDHDLGLGAMSNSFDINPVTVNGQQISRQQLIDKYWWAGDYMTNADCEKYFTCIHYDGFNIPDTDNPLQTTHGLCWHYGPQGATGGDYIGGTPPPCNGANPIYIEPASGFWIQNANTVLTGNAIGGCQGNGRAFWWVPPRIPIKVNGDAVELQFQPLGKFKDNRASACYGAYFGENDQTESGQLFPHQGGKNGAPSIVATFDGMTATHNRFRAVWLRPVWFVIKNGHFADNNRSVTLVTSGGIEGNAPGVWELLEDSVLVGLSENNVGRWGPCPKTEQLGKHTGWQYGCIDSTPAPASTKPHSGELNGKGYPWPSQNSFGYMLYDGPVRVFHDRFVNYNYNQGWTADMPCAGDEAGAFYLELDAADCSALKAWEKANRLPYEGDAALGWFPANQSAYPTGTVSRELMWVNTNLRHQIYTEHVKINSTFGDSDKNTAIIDEDGTLSGLGVLLDTSAGSKTVHPISLNNLPFNTVSNAVDECLSRGGQNQSIEGRDSSLMSPVTIGTLEFSTLYPWLPQPGPQGLKVFPGGAVTHWQKATFTRDDTIPNGKGGSLQPSMSLFGRAGRGLFEPKVSNGYGYTVAVAPATAPFIPPDQNSHKAGIWKWIDVGMADVVDANIDAQHPFFIRLGINYTSTDGTHPADNFTIKRGYKTYKGGLVWEGDPILLKYWTDWPNCQNIDGNSLTNIPWSGNNFTAGCPAGDSTRPVKTLTEVKSIAGLTNTDGSPNLGVYYYNKTTGYLYLNVAQDEPNPVGPAPTGSCDSTYDGGTPDSSCPDLAAGETYYACPKNGCIIYTIAQNDPNYDPGPSVGQPAAADAKTAPAKPNRLVLHGTQTVITRETQLDKQGTPYNTATNGPACPPTKPPAQ